MKRVAIVGGGLSSVYAILACNECGIKPDIFIKDVADPVGAVYFSFLPEPVKKRFKAVNITMSMKGTADCYVRKQWQEIPPSYYSSFPKEQHIVEGYDPVNVMKRIFASLRSCNRIELDHNMNEADLIGISSSYSYVFHSFASRSVRDAYSKYVVMFPVVIQFAGGYQFLDESQLPNKYNFNNMIIYDGTPESIVVRESFLFGKRYLELSPRNDYSKEELEIIFPRSTVRMLYDLDPSVDVSAEDLDKLRIAPNIIPIGRAARFSRKDVAYSTFYQVRRLLNAESE